MNPHNKLLVAGAFSKQNYDTPTNLQQFYNACEENNWGIENIVGKLNHYILKEAPSLTIGQRTSEKANEILIKVANDLSGTTSSWTKY